MKARCQISVAARSQLLPEAACSNLAVGPSPDSCSSTAGSMLAGGSSVVADAGAADSMPDAGTLWQPGRVPLVFGSAAGSLLAAGSSAAGPGLVPVSLGMWLGCGLHQIAVAARAGWSLVKQWWLERLPMDP
jgi:hypothetical protein